MTKEELCKFCDPSHPKMCGPFSVGNFTYATNNHILLRVPRLSDVPEWEAWNEKSAVLFDHVDYPAVTAALRAIPDFTLPEAENCYKCAGTGQVATCPECNGEGGVSFDTDYHEYECDCKTCDGHGTVEGNSAVCRICDGSGKEEVIQKVKVGDVLFSSRYLTMLKGLPNILIAPTAVAAPNYFKWDGGDGLLMPMRG